MKVCLSASGGGHLSLLLKLADSWAGYEVVYITTTNLVRSLLSRNGKVYVIKECNRQNPLQLVKVLFQCLGIIVREKPKVVISTGAAGGCITCFIAKLTGAKIVWVDSLTNVRKLSLSGRLVRHIADMFLVQWPELAQKYKNVEFVGNVG
jgi:UDP-N-acetylglucosamine:LPS N-acetylglucosamine transferase